YLMENAGDPEALQVITARLNQQYAVQVVADGKTSSPIVTVTTLDAEIHGLTEAELVEEYAQQIRQGLLQAVEERQPSAQQQHLKRAVMGGAIAVLLVTLLYLWQQRMDKIRRQLRQVFPDQQILFTQAQTIPDDDGETSPNLSEQQNHLFELKRRIERKTWQKRTLQLSMLGAGMTGVAWVLQRFPQTRSLGILLFRQPLMLFLLGILITSLIILSHLFIDRMLNKWVGTEDQLSLAQIDRRRRRLLVLSPAWKGMITIFWVVVGLVLAYSLVSISTGLTLFTQIGVLGLAISLAFQSMIKDALTGWILLARDALTIGDTVAVKDASGVVEAMGVIITQIRSSAGELITIRNGEISQLTNRSKDWSRMDLTVLVDYSTDLKQAMTLMREVFQTMKTDPIWKQHLTGEPDILGVEQFDQNGVLLKIRTQTEPGQQFGVSREFRLRLNQVFKAAGVRIAIPQQEVRYRELN
ncbi:MAG: mechanosensitive ion channel family protein, partial [Elainella sp.]